MRADRLISIILYLQQHAHVTAEKLSSEMEVSVRTIYRDLQALSAAGIPVYAERGVGGGVRLLEDYRTDLTGLSSGEVESLLLLNIPDALTGLETGRQLKTALAKITAVIHQRDRDAASQQRLVLNWAGWGQAGVEQPFLSQLYQAARSDQKINVEYLMINGRTISRVVDLYGLVAKAGEWYVIFKGNGRMHWQPLFNLTNVRISDEKFIRDPDFDLAVYWQRIRNEVEETRMPFKAVLSCQSELVGFLREYFRDVKLAQIHSIQQQNGEKTQIEIAFPHLESARTQILGLGTAVDVISPIELSESVKMFAQTILEKYQNK